jgi:regulation of enolase protein 1 (concanavalin A-like superfamily)
LVLAIASVSNASAQPPGFPPPDHGGSRGTSARRAAIPGWGTVIDPEGDCTIQPAGGKLTISVPGTTHDMWFGAPEARNRFNAPRVMREVAGDFVARVKVTLDWNLTSGSSYNGAGLVVWDSENQYLRLERNRYVRGSEPRGPFSGVAPLYDVNGQRAPGWKSLPDEFYRGRSTWLRIERDGTRITTSVSHDGLTWVQTGAYATQFPHRVQVGLLVINTSPRGCVAEFEDFKLLRE